MSNQSALSVPDTVSFEEAIALTQSLLSHLQQGQLSDSELESVTRKLVSSQNGARGFFVTYLTDERRFADEPSPAVLSALESSAEIVSELLVKNLAMSAAMVVAHRRRQDEEMAQQSARVSDRSAHLIQSLQLPRADELAQLMLESARTGEGHYQSFLQRWRYDEEQREAIEQAVQRVTR